MHKLCFCFTYYFSTYVCMLQYISTPISHFSCTVFHNHLSALPFENVKFYTPIKQTKKNIYIQQASYARPHTQTHTLKLTRESWGRILQRSAKQHQMIKAFDFTRECAWVCASFCVVVTSETISLSRSAVHVSQISRPSQDNGLLQLAQQISLSTVSLLKCLSHLPPPAITGAETKKIKLSTSAQSSGEISFVN